MDKKVMAIIGAGVIGAGALLFINAPSYAPGGFGGVGSGGSKKDVITTEATPLIDPDPPVYNITFPDPNFPEIPQMDYAEILALTNVSNGETGTKKATYQPPRGIVKDIREIIQTPGMSASRTRGLIDKMRQLESTKKEKTVQEIVKTPGMSASRTKDLAEKLRALNQQNTKKTTTTMPFKFGMFRMIGGN